MGSPAAGDRAAVPMGLMASCKSCEVGPWAWLTNVLTELPRATPPDSLLPDVWLHMHPEHRWTIADRRRRERHKKGHL